jgi:regulator of sigma E protease
MFSQITHTILIAIEVLLIFNLLIVVHELGHFLAARWRGLVIDEFGVWFGKPIWRKKFGDVWYSIGSIPAGGFVKLPQLAPMDAIEGESEVRTSPLQPITPLDKIIVALAGPVFSFLLAVVMATIVWGVGKPVHEFEVTTVIGYVKPNGPADKAGLKPGDRILEVDGKPVDRFIGPLHAVTWRVVRSEGETIPFKIERDGKVITIESGWEREENPKWKRKGLRKVYIAQRITPSIGKVEPGSPAEAAGLEEGDLITAVNETPVVDLSEFFNAIEKTGVAPITVTVERNGKDERLKLTPAPPLEGSKTPHIGVAWGRMMLIHPDPITQVADAVATIRNMLDALLSPKSDVKAQHFSGPVGILRTYYNLFADEQGWRLALAFSVFFNVNLALFNLLPFPILDGGHITLAIFEAVRRRPIQGAMLEYVQTACAIAVMSFIAYVTFFDVSDFFSGKKEIGAKKAPADSAEQAPASAPAGK